MKPYPMTRKRALGRQRMNHRRGVRVRPLKFYILRVWADEDQYVAQDGTQDYNVVYLQGGEQWRGGVYAKDELSAWVEAKKELRAGNMYLGRHYY